MAEPEFSRRMALQWPPDASRPGELAGAQQKHETKTTVEGWEKCLRKQIITHPRIALGAGLMVGILTGWWVKR
jgi:hypothetical protein